MADRRVVIASLYQEVQPKAIWRQDRHQDSGGVGIGLGVVRNVVTQDGPEGWDWRGSARSAPHANTSLSERCVQTRKSEGQI